MVTVTVRLAIFPLTIKQLRSAAGMQAVAPKIKQIQNKYKDKKSREDSARPSRPRSWRSTKSTTSTRSRRVCPLVFQIPVFIGLNSVLRYHIHPTGGESFLFINNIFVKMSDLPAGQEYLLTGLYLLSMLGSTLLFSFITDKQQRYLFAGMSVVFAFFIKGFTVGLVIYWITTNLWTIGQQGLIKKTMGNRFPHLQTQPKGRMRAAVLRALPADEPHGCRRRIVVQVRRLEGNRGAIRAGTPEDRPQPHAEGHQAGAEEQQARRRRQMSDARCEATGETEADARYAALHELERRYPDLDRDAVEYQLVSEGARGVLGSWLRAGSGRGDAHAACPRRAAPFARPRAPRRAAGHRDRPRSAHAGVRSPGRHAGPGRRRDHGGRERPHRRSGAPSSRPRSRARISVSSSAAMARPLTRSSTSRTP